MNRRDFLKLGIMGATTVAAGLNGLGGLSESASPELAGPVYRTLGRTGLNLTIVSFGAMLTPESEVIQAGLDRGINYIDTARKYMNGKNEEIVARAIKGRRDKIYLATKTLPTAQTGQDIITDVETSLTALKTDHIDVIQLHNLNSKERAFVPGVREALVGLREQGKVRFFGVTTHTNQADVINAIVDDPDRFFDTVLVAYNFKSEPEVKQAIARAARAHIGVIAMKTQAGGYQTEALGPISPHQAALKWVLQDTNVTAAIPGMKDLSQLNEDIAVMGMRVTRTDRQILQRYAEAIGPYYCHLCARCETSCPQGVAISTINRSLMYAEAYGEIELARTTYNEVPPDASALTCLDCPHCVARCVNGISIASKMSRAHRLLG